MSPTSQPMDVMLYDTAMCGSQAGLEVLRLNLIRTPALLRNMSHIGQVTESPWVCLLVWKIGGISTSQGLGIR